MVTSDKRSHTFSHLELTYRYPLPVFTAVLTRMGIPIALDATLGRDESLTTVQKTLPILQVGPGFLVHKTMQDTYVSDTS